MTKLRHGAKEKFVVLKMDDINELDAGSKAYLDIICTEIEAKRLTKGKNINNQYVVINMDEPYFPRIKEIMEENGHWG